MVKKITKHDALMEMVTALRDENNQVLVETLLGEGSTKVGNPRIPKKGDERVKLGNRIDAESIKIGKNITVKKRPNGRWLVRTQSGEVVFDYWKDEGLDKVLLDALNKYQFGENANPTLSVVRKYSHDEELRKNANSEITSKTSKYKRAIKQIEEMGINSENMKKKMKEQFLGYSME